MKTKPRTNRQHRRRRREFEVTPQRPLIVTSTKRLRVRIEYGEGVRVERKKGGS